MLHYAIHNIAGWAQYTTVLPTRFPYCLVHIDSIVKNSPSNHSISFHLHLAERVTFSTRTRQT